MSSTILKLQTVTPMFLAGADGQTFDLRPPSIKGVLRFWWRAYYWGSHHNAITIEEISRVEGEIFGGTSDNAKKSCFSIRMKPINVSPTSKPLPQKRIPITSGGKTLNLDIINYLAYGIKQNKRQYIPEGQEFELRLSFRQETTEVGGTIFNVKEEILRSAYFLLTLGGLGAKSRNGFGSLKVLNPKEIFKEISTEFSYPFSKKIFPFSQTMHNPAIPPFSAFSKGMKIFILDKDDYATWAACLADIGEIYRQAREDLEGKHYQCSKRQFIGAPMVIKTRHGKKESFLERRAKPYFMRIRKTEKGYGGHILYLPSNYCGGAGKGPLTDRSGRPINHSKVDAQFTDYCNELNTYLKRQLKELP
ncbi:type III-B CRISPR module RAMP protein Cmr1 [candidate division KSB3 bacterium]|uniref:Type III-B CRISPR module RAMP protein Cmr1 n=1 Tax=candidate division KSB3 bacterium TaxID=2044937 RepID=A0A2G6KJ64_9BACT|nr:MAG: type III-B CRISPR module RAMP protein Cmr1 [candidate division KSB3 bacterium]